MVVSDMGLGWKCTYNTKAVKRKTKHNDNIH